MRTLCRSGTWSRLQSSPRAMACPCCSSQPPCGWWPQPSRAPPSRTPPWPRCWTRLPPCSSLACCSPPGWARQHLPERLPRRPPAGHRPSGAACLQPSRPWLHPAATGVRPCRASIPMQAALCLGSPHLRRSVSAREARPASALAAFLTEAHSAPHTQPPRSSLVCPLVQAPCSLPRKWMPGRPGDRSPSAALSGTTQERMSTCPPASGCWSLRQLCQTCLLSAPALPQDGPRHSHAALNGHSAPGSAPASASMSRAASGQLPSPANASPEFCDVRKEGPVWLQARLAPLHPKQTAQLALLAASQDSLFAGEPPAGCAQALACMCPWCTPAARLHFPSASAATDEPVHAAALSAAAASRLLVEKPGRLVRVPGRPVLQAPPSVGASCSGRALRAT